ncbi:MAG: alpha/beta hydrolase [Pelodictyon phaeoclathratiforme]
MNLLILPGGGNPDTSPTYRKVYYLIAREAKKYGYDQVYSDIRWPGHVSLGESYDKVPSLTLSGAVSVAIAAINNLPDEPFTILGRSFGCFVALKLADHENEMVKRPVKNILWGPDPYWQLWRDFVRDLEGNTAIAKEKGLKVDASSFASMEPVEVLLRKITVPTLVTSGALDTACTPSFMTYLSSIAEGNNMVRVNKIPVNGAKHEVTEESGMQVVNDYSDALFKD